MSIKTDMKEILCIENLHKIINKEKLIYFDELSSISRSFKSNRSALSLCMHRN